MPAIQRPIIPAVVAQHLEDAASIRNVRSVLLRAPHVELHRLARFDERLAAHLDGMFIAGDEGYRMALAELERPALGQVFTVAALALHRGDVEQLHKLLALAAVVPDVPRALASAMGWTSAQALRGWAGPLLASADPWHQWLGLAACAAHRVDPGAALVKALKESNQVARAARIAAQVGRVDLVPTLLEHQDDACAWSAVLLGDRHAALAALRAASLGAGHHNLEALELYLLAASPDAARTAVRELASSGAPVRIVIRASGWAGDVQAIPWLVKQMSDLEHARVAGEAFSFITGADLAKLDLEIKGPQPTTPGGPNDDPDDDNVALDEDESLPWPDVALVQAWWAKQGGAMPASGQRCFMGAAVSRTHCVHVLNTAGQRQRYAAALLLCLMAPGTPLFNIAAPSRRQQRLLVGMG